MNCERRIAFFSNKKNKNKLLNKSSMIKSNFRKIIEKDKENKRFNEKFRNICLKS